MDRHWAETVREERTNGRARYNNQRRQQQSNQIIVKKSVCPFLSLVVGRDTLCETTTDRPTPNNVGVIFISPLRTLRRVFIYARRMIWNSAVCTSSYFFAVSLIVARFSSAALESRNVSSVKERNVVNKWGGVGVVAELGESVAIIAKCEI